MPKTLPNLMKTVNPWNPETQGSPSTTNTKKTVPKHIMIKLLKASDKQKTLKTDITQCTVSKVRTAADFWSHGIGQHREAMSKIPKTQTKTI